MKSLALISIITIFSLSQSLTASGGISVHLIHKNKPQSDYLLAAKSAKRYSRLILAEGKTDQRGLLFLELDRPQKVRIHLKKRQDQYIEADYPGGYHALSIEVCPTCLGSGGSSTSSGRGKEAGEPTHSRVHACHSCKGKGGWISTR